jgi:hypothetical protein
MLYEQNKQIGNIIRTLEVTNETATSTAMKLKEQDVKIQNIADTVYLRGHSIFTRSRTKRYRGRIDVWTRTPTC